MKSNGNSVIYHKKIKRKRYLKCYAGKLFNIKLIHINTKQNQHQDQQVSQRAHGLYSL